MIAMAQMMKQQKNFRRVRRSFHKIRLANVTVNVTYYIHFL